MMNVYGQCWRFVTSAMVAAVLVLGVSGCNTPQGGPGHSGLRASPVEQDPGAPGPVPTDSDTLFAGDRITILFYGPPNPPLPHIEQIRNDGFITPPLLEKPVQAKDKTIGQLQADLHKLYVPDFFQTLTITVKNEERFFFVGGDVRIPGQKPYLSGMTLLRAIQASGDFNEYANEASVQITRADGRSDKYNCRDIQRRLAEDPPIYPKDQIYVPRSVIF